MITLAIDPGVSGRGNACALLDGLRLTDAWFERVVRGPAVRDDARTLYDSSAPVDQIVVERPADRGGKARAQDLIDLAWEGALLAGAFAGRDGARLIEYVPHDARNARCPRHGHKRYRAAKPCACACFRGWKGTESKPLMHRRLWATLLPAERKILGGRSTESMIRAACEKGALSRWSRPGASYYPAKWDTHNLLDAACLGRYHLGLLDRIG